MIRRSIMKQGRIENRIYRKKTIQKYQEKCLFLGTDINMNVYSFLNMRLGTTLLLFLLFLIIDYRNLLVNILLSGAYYYLFSKLYLDSKLEKRRRKLEKEAILFFEVVALSLESGRNLIDSLEMSSNSVEGNLSLEFRNALKEMEYGKSFKEALQSLKLRIPSPSIQNMILNLGQSNAYGNNMVLPIREQLNYIREMRILGVKAQINKMPIQISVVSVLLFVPIVLLLVLSPVIVKLLLP